MRRLAVAVAVALIVGVAAAGPASAAPVTSPNWSGYVAQATQQFTGATGRWKQPAAECGTSGRAAAAFWVGLDGYQDQTVEQIGAQAKCNGGVAAYYAWWQMWPSPVHDLAESTYPVRPSDVLTASVERTGGDYTLSLGSSEGWQFATTEQATAEDTSAEWVASSPRLCHDCRYALLTDFQDLRFTDVKAAVGGPLRPLASFTDSGGPISLLMMDAAGTVRARAGPIGCRGRSFVVTWAHS